MRNSYRFRLLIIWILLFGLSPTWSVLRAARYVKIAVIGTVPKVDKNQEPSKLVDQVIGFWKRQFAQVLPDKPDLIVLTEACDRPGGMTSEQQFSYFRERGDRVKGYFASVARENRCYLAFGMKRQAANGNWFNSSFVLDRTGQVAGVYNKNFPTVGELEAGIKAGDEVPVIQCDFGRVACAICFDLNFPELLRKYQAAKPDIILFSSMYHGGLVQSYWAYSCRSFFAASIGGTATPSEIRNPLGEVVASTRNYFDFVVTTINLDSRLVHLDGNWEKLAKLKNKYGPSVTIHDPGEVGAVLVSSEDDKVSVDQMVGEFQIELLDDYLNRSRQFRLKPGNRE